MSPILAKSCKPDQEPVTLLQHTHDVVNSAKALFGDNEPTSLGRRWLEFFKIEESAWEIFRRDLIVACAIHDWGKANNSFQDAIRRQGKQAIRHEHLSALLIGLPEVTRWLEAGGVDVPLVLSSVLTHHLKAGGNKSDLADRLSDSPNGFQLVGGSGEFQELVDACCDWTGLSHLETAEFPHDWGFGRQSNDIYEHRDRLDCTLRTLKKSLRKSPDRRRMLTALRSALIAADAAGSGLVREGRSIFDWINSNVTNTEPLTKSRVWSGIIDKRVAEMKAAGKWKDHGDGKEGWTDFQIVCDKLPERALLLAPCGSGKTLAAWRWIAAQLDQRPVNHVLFLYPTRATAREGFRDYVSWAPEADAALMHGTSGFDLAEMFENPPEGDERCGRNYEVERRLFSLGYWPRRAFSATVDQFLAFMQYGYGPMCMLPVLANSVIVIDEVHSFDRNMFAALKDFLLNFNVPVLCMTATLSSDRRDQLIECGLIPPPEWPDDLMAIAQQPRYRLCRVASRNTAMERVREALDQGQRVLWVVNQVRRVHEIVRELIPEFDPGSGDTELYITAGIPVACYHSRFKLTDRIDRHAETMRFLKKPARGEQRAALGVTTQVCEMSLDIDVDLLVTEECPVTSLVQRMGRCNRERTARPLDHSGEILVYAPDDPAPYSDNDLTGVPEFLNQTMGNDLSQAAINDIMSSVPSPEREGDPNSRFLTSGPYAVGPREDDSEGFREGNDFNLPCVLSSDVGDFNAADAKSRPGFILPVPRKLAKCRDNENDPAHARLPNYLHIAQPDRYHPAIGYCDDPLSNWSNE